MKRMLLAGAPHLDEVSNDILLVLMEIWSVDAIGVFAELVAFDVPQLIDLHCFVCSAAHALGGLIVRTSCPGVHERDVDVCVCVAR